ncbi:beta-lactamase family protein [Yinghuangia sp. ASG 101]|uniref:serine hydrolase domain-containing protein n=1 Tax=Yinghuangia sp. ASG 101 TaxID=2896848 RepID=UPI001E5F2C25|nr:serine hydrolase domain-containing protein [Yinghuangia sp. ASG 101]UGQ14055.1 beta-lactamase family protein [Yinghuangia sp. ASG 101]
MESLRVIESWPVPRAAAVVAADGGVVGERGPVDVPFRLASVTKPLTAYAVLVAVEEGAVELDEPAGPPGATVRHLLAHTAGYAFDHERVMARPGDRRIYSNAGFEVLARHVERQCDIPFAAYLDEAVLRPLGMTDSRLDGSPAADAVATAADLARFAAEVMAPKLLAPETVAEATSVVFPGLDGVVPGYGLQRPNDWGLGFEIRGHKAPHWTGSRNSPATFGHFGQRGTFLWIDPEARAATVCLTDRDFGPWAVEAWPAFNDGVLTDLGR